MAGTFNISMQIQVQYTEANNDSWLQRSADVAFSLPDGSLPPVTIFKPAPQMNRVTSYNFITFTTLIGLWTLIVIGFTVHHQVTKSNNRYVLAMSMRAHYDKLLTVNRSQKVIKCIDGIRSMSIFWVIIGHIISQNLAVVDNLHEILGRAAHGYLVGILSGMVSVDTFFLIGGLLTAYLATNMWEKALKSGPMGVIKSYVLFILNRYWRLTPVLLIAMGFGMSVWPIIGNGPIFGPATNMANMCYSNWWIALLYGGAFLQDPDQICLPWIWYLM